MVSLHAGVIHNQTEIFMVPKLFCTGSIISPQFVITAGGLWLPQILKKMFHCSKTFHSRCLYTVVFHLQVSVCQEEVRGLNLKLSLPIWKVYCLVKSLAILIRSDVASQSTPF